MKLFLQQLMLLPLTVAAGHIRGSRKALEIAPSKEMTAPTAYSSTEMAAPTTYSTDNLYETNFRAQIELLNGNDYCVEVNLQGIKSTILAGIKETQAEMSRIVAEAPAVLASGGFITMNFDEKVPNGRRLGWRAGAYGSARLSYADNSDGFIPPGLGLAPGQDDSPLNFDFPAVIAEQEQAMEALLEEQAEDRAIYAEEKAKHDEEVEELEGKKVQKVSDIAVDQAKESAEWDAKIAKETAAYDKKIAEQNKKMQELIAKKLKDQKKFSEEKTKIEAEIRKLLAEKAEKVAKLEYEKAKRNAEYEAKKMKEMTNYDVKIDEEVAKFMEEEYPVMAKMEETVQMLLSDQQFELSTVETAREPARNDIQSAIDAFAKEAEARAEEKLADAFPSCFPDSKPNVLLSLTPLPPNYE